MEEENLKKIRREFSENTSCHGIGQMYASKSKWQRAFWCFLVIAVFGILASQVALRIQAFLARKTTTSITEKYNTTLPMPAITVCNFNSFFNISANNETDAIKELAKANSNSPLNHEVSYENISYFSGVFGGSIREFAIKKGWDLHKSLLWCRFGGETCLANNFTYTIGEMGKCWTYQAPRSVNKAGSKRGIHMVFDVHQDEYTESYYYGRWEAGIKVQIHSATNVPEVDEFGLAVPVGNMGFVTIKMIEEKLMYQPWGECEPNKEKLYLYDTYSRANCVNECYMRALAERCNCRLYYFDEPASLPECTPAETVDCLRISSGLLKPYITPERCGCQPPCRNKRFETTISYGAFPNSAIQDAVGNNWSNATKEYMSRNLVGIRVYYETLSYVKREENQQMTWSGLLSDLGGQLGLWIGISVVTMFEFVQFAALHFRALWRKMRNRKEHDFKAEHKKIKRESDDTKQMTKSRRVHEHNV